MKRTAQCCCGEVVLEALGESRQYGMYHCNNCKKRTGSAFGLSAYFLKDNIIFISGQPSCYQLTNPNDVAEQKRYFCGNCGTTVCWSVSSLPELVGVAGGCFTESPLPKPSYSSSHGSKFPWLKVPFGIKKIQ